jgi:hypothetical protein
MSKWLLASAIFASASFSWGSTSASFNPKMADVLSTASGNVMVVVSRLEMKPEIIKVYTARTVLIVDSFGGHYVPDQKSLGDAEQAVRYFLSSGPQGGIVVVDDASASGSCGILQCFNLRWASN